MNIILAALLLFQAIQASPLVDNDFVRVFKNSAPCAAAAASCGERVVVALGSVEVNGKKWSAAISKDFKAGERYSASKGRKFSGSLHQADAPESDAVPAAWNTACAGQ